MVEKRLKYDHLGGSRQAPKVPGGLVTTDSYVTDAIYIYSQFVDILSFSTCLCHVSLGQLLREDNRKYGTKATALTPCGGQCHVNMLLYAG